MKTLLFLLIGSLLLFGHPPDSKHGFNKPVATCYGNSPCKACKNCNYCGYCNRGGTCGICSSKTQKSTEEVRKPVSKTSKAEVSSQCKATTKKGTRCKRTAGSSGYCWQHGSN